MHGWATGGPVLHPDCPGDFEPPAEHLHQRGREHHDAVFVALTTTDRHRAALEVDVLDSQAEALRDPQSGAKQHRCHLIRRPWQMRDDRPGLASRHPHRHADFFLGPNPRRQRPNRPPDQAVKTHNGIERLRLSGGRSVESEPRQIGRHPLLDRRRSGRRRSFHRTKPQEPAHMRPVGLHRRPSLSLLSHARVKKSHCFACFHINPTLVRVISCYPKKLKTSPTA